MTLPWAIVTVAVIGGAGAVLVLAQGLREARAWRTIIQAYLEARCKEAGVPMQVPAPASEPGGRLYEPFGDEPEDEEFQ